jgi:hypothetical protein
MVREFGALDLLPPGQDVQPLLSSNHVQLHLTMDHAAFRESLIACKDDLTLNLAELTVKDVCPADCEWSPALVSQAKAGIAQQMAGNYANGHAVYNIPLRVVDGKDMPERCMDGEIKEPLFKNIETFRGALRVCPHVIRQP